MEAKRNKRTASEQGRASREKGKRFERAVAAFFKENGVDARRSAQYCGRSGQAHDIDNVPGISVECKYTERLQLEAAWNQAVRDAEAAGKGEIPVVIHKRSRKPTMITMALEDWIGMYLAWIEKQGWKGEKPDEES